jgi:hypothetical protein
MHPPDPIRPLRVEPIHEDKLAREKEEKKPPEEDPGLLALLVQAFRQMVDFFLMGKRTQPIRTQQELRRLKEAFEILKAEDRSQDARFLANLSDIWQKILETHPQAALKELVRELNSYPEHQSHTFGYYLTEHAGQKWIPFPYMELIQKIHKDPHLLTKWIGQIALILNRE